jgi:hypothetical protein
MEIGVIPEKIPEILVDLNLSIVDEDCGIRRLSTPSV